MPAVDIDPEALSCVDDVKLVVNGVLPSMTCAPDMKFVPARVRVKEPVGMLAGLVLVSVGVGLIRVTLLEADFEVSATLVAVMVMVFGVGRAVGAA